MKTRNYTVNRDEIYVGLVSLTQKDKIIIYNDGLYDTSFSTHEEIQRMFDNRKFLLGKRNQLCYDGPTEFLRSMLFVLDNENCASDLLYNSPHYPIFNISNNDICINSSISIKNHCYQIGKVLKYFGYKDELVYEDIVRIKDFFFGDFILDNCELFGRYETTPNGTSYETYDSFGNHRTFNKNKKDSIFPECYFEAFWETRKKFIPNELEGPIKILKRL